MIKFQNRPIDIQELFVAGMDRTIPPIYTPDKGKSLNIGPGAKRAEDDPYWDNFCDIIDYPRWDADSGDPIPASSESYDIVHCYHFLEHCREPKRILAEIQRVLKIGGVANICVPYYTSQMAAQDLDHKARFCEETWRNTFANPYYNKDKIVWRFRVHLNIIIGVAERNLCLLTQLVKE